MAKPHETLGVAADASFDEIRAAYRRLAMKHHPDRGGDIEDFRRIQAAYDALYTKRQTTGPFDHIFSDIAREYKRENT